MDNRRKTIAILAMTADGKISDYKGSAARFGSTSDKLHLEQQISLVDGAIFGAGTLRAYQTTMSVSNSQLQAAREKRGQAPQPVQIVVSASGHLDPQWRFFQQPVPRWLLTVPQVAKTWRDRPEFEHIITVNIIDDNPPSIDWLSALAQLHQLGLNKLAILGGGELMASLIAIDALDELWLTLCPVIFGGKTAPTPVGGGGLLQSQAKKLQLLEIKQVKAEVFLHYRVIRNQESAIENINNVVNLQTSLGNNDDNRN